MISKRKGVSKMKQRKNASYLRQAAVLISRYFRIFFNDKQNLLLTIAIPLLTIIIVALVASGDMYSPKTKMDHSINNGYPILAWQQVVQEKSDEFTINSCGVGEIEGEPCVYVIFEKNKYSELIDKKLTVKDNNGDEIINAADSEIMLINGEDCGIYSAYYYFNDDEFNEGNVYKLNFSSDVNSTDDENYGTLENELEFKVSDLYEDVTDLVTEAENAYDSFVTLESDFDLNDYVFNNQEKLLSLSKAQMSIDGNDYIVINDAETLAFIISDKSDLFGFNNEDWYEYNYYLNCDIDLNEYTGVMPLGDNEEMYAGIFDGNGHVIRHLSLESSKSNCGFIGVLKGTVKNIGFENCVIDTTKQNAGVIAGSIASNGKILNSYVINSSVNADNGYAGAVAGNVNDKKENGKNAEISSCYVNGVEISSRGNCVGGLVGDLNNAYAKACYAVADFDVSTSASNVGMIAGAATELGYLENCVYIQNDDYNAVGKVLNSVDNKRNNVIGISEEKLKEFSSKLSYTSNFGDETEYFFKKDGQLDLYGGTQTGLFMLVCVAIFVGICNSIQEVCKERNILKREYMTNLKLTAYMTSKLVVQAAVCAVQILLILAIFAVSIRDKEMYSTGIIFNSIWSEYFVTMFLLAFSADAIALVISSIVKNSSTANTFIPIILIVQIVFSGVLFDLGKAMNNFASVMISKWGIAGLAISSRLNDSRNGFLLDSPEFELNLGSAMSTVKDLYMSSAANLIKVWGILLLFIIISSVLSTVLLTRVKKDKR